MNTREREVMDALASALRGVHPNPGLSTTLAAYDALLAEGSASSEGAELPALVEEGLTYFHKAGDAGDKLYVEAIRDHIAALEQRTSERRPVERNEVSAIADEVVLPPLPEPTCLGFRNPCGITQLPDMGIYGYTADQVRECQRAALESAHQRGLPAGSDMPTLGSGDFAQQHTASDDTPSKSRLKRIAAQQRQGGAK